MFVYTRGVQILDIWSPRPLNLLLWHMVLSLWQVFLSTYKNVYQGMCTKQKVIDKCKGHRVLQNTGASRSTLCMSSFRFLQLEVATRFLGKFLYPFSIPRTINILCDLIQTCQMCLQHQSHLITQFIILVFYIIT